MNKRRYDLNIDLSFCLYKKPEFFSPKNKKKQVYQIVNFADYFLTILLPIHIRLTAQCSTVIRDCYVVGGIGQSEAKYINTTR